MVSGGGAVSGGVELELAPQSLHVRSAHVSTGAQHFLPPLPSPTPPLPSPKRAQQEHANSTLHGETLASGPEEGEEEPEGATTSPSEGSATLHAAATGITQICKTAAPAGGAAYFT